VKKLKIYISGSSGFLGSNFDRHLKKKFEIKHFFAQDKSSFDLDTNDFIDECSFFIHLSEPSLKHIYDDQLCKKLKQNIENLSKVLKNKLIYFSSGSVYGDKSITPYDEDSKVFCNDPYSKLKLINEKTVLKNGGMVLRLSNVIGKGMHKKNVLGHIKKFIDNKNQDLTILNTTSIRDYIHVNDVSKFIELVILSGRTKNTIYNVGSGFGTSVHEIINTLNTKFDHKFEKIIETKKIDDLSCNILSIKKANKDFNWMPDNVFKDIIDKIYT
tara:strand:+ start:675 stop:1487 length:813 start_codon:yes stop_codon:yes gene_type:complete